MNSNLKVESTMGRGCSAGLHLLAFGALIWIFPAITAAKGLASLLAFSKEPVVTANPSPFSLTPSAECESSASSNYSNASRSDWGPGDTKGTGYLTLPTTWSSDTCPIARAANGSVSNLILQPLPRPPARLSLPANTASTTWAY